MEDTITKENLAKFLASRALSPEEAKKLNEVLELKADGANVRVENGHQFLRQLKKEAKRQKMMKIAENLELQTRDISQVPVETYSTSEELALADTFDIIEED